MMNTSFSGKQRIQVMRKGVCRLDTGFQKNLVLDNLFNRLIAVPGTTINGWATGSSASHTCFVGTGATTPVPEDTELDTLLASQNQTSGTVPSGLSLSDDGVNYEHEVTRVFEFTEGAVVGNLAEVGTRIGVASGNLDTRALILDTEGDPTVITLFADDKLIVTHKFTTKIKSTVTTSIITKESVDYTFNLKPYDIDTTSNPTFFTALNSLRVGLGSHVIAQLYSTITFGDVINGVSGSDATNASSGQVCTPIGNVIGGEFSGDFSMAIPASTGNVPGGEVGGFYYRSGAVGNQGFQVQISPPVLKDADKKLTFVLRHKFTRE